MKMLATMMLLHPGAAAAMATTVTFESVGLANSAVLWPNGQEAFRSDPSALSFQHPTGDPNKAVALVFSSDGAASSNVSSWVLGHRHMLRLARLTC
jgi:hypothetical protein